MAFLGRKSILHRNFAGSILCDYLPASDTAVCVKMHWVVKDREKVDPMPLAGIVIINETGGS